MIDRNKVSDRLFYFHTKDLRTLRAKVRYVDEDITNYKISKMARDELVRKLVEHELGFEVVSDYFAQCQEWDEMKSFAEYGVLPK